MRASRTLLLIAVLTLGADVLAAQTRTPTSVTEFDSPNPADFEIFSEETPPPFAQMPNAVPVPPAPNSRQNTEPDVSAETKRYQVVVKSLEKNRHQFIHCQLKSGKILTGLIRGGNDQGFTLHTNVLGGEFVRYEDLADAPKPVPAVGTRIKQGAQWAGVGVLIVVALPVMIVLSPLLFASGWQC